MISFTVRERQTGNTLSNFLVSKKNIDWILLTIRSHVESDSNGMISLIVDLTQ